LFHRSKALSHAKTIVWISLSFFPKILSRPKKNDQDEIPVNQLLTDEDNFQTDHEYQDINFGHPNIYQ